MKGLALFPGLHKILGWPPILCGPFVPLYDKSSPKVFVHMVFRGSPVLQNNNYSPLFIGVILC